MKQFYAYVHARPDGRVFYVGKGHGKRAQHLRKRSDYHQNVINKYGAENILIGKLDCSSEKIAFDLEKGLIKCLMRMGVVLVNQTLGGEGASGFQHSAETKEICRYRATGKNNANYGKKRPDHAAALAGRKRPDQSIRMRKFFETNPHPRGMLGRSHTEATKQLMSEKTTERCRAQALTQKGKFVVSREGYHSWIEPYDLPAYIALGWKRGWK